MAKFVRLLGLPNASASYDHLQDSDEAEDEYGIEEWEQFLHIAKEPEPGDEQISSAKAKLGDGNFDGALADYRRAVELNPELAQSDYYRSELAMLGKAYYSRD